MNAATLLATQLAAFPGLNALSWNLAGSQATASLEELGGIHLRPADPAKDERPGSQILAIDPPPDALPTMEPLRVHGWRIWGSYSDMPGAWAMAAEIRAGSARLLLRGTMAVRTDGIRWGDALAHATSCYFSPPPPPLGHGAKARALSAEWMDRLSRHDWDGWDATPLPPARLPRELWGRWADLTREPAAAPQEEQA